jgi:hypothetical protein
LRQPDSHVSHQKTDTQVIQDPDADGKPGICARGRTGHCSNASPKRTQRGSRHAADSSGGRYNSQTKQQTGNNAADNRPQLLSGSIIDGLSGIVACKNHRVIERIHAFGQVNGV